MNPTISGVLGPGFLNQVPTLHLIKPKPPALRTLQSESSAASSGTTSASRMSLQRIPGWSTWRTECYFVNVCTLLLLTADRFRLIALDWFGLEFRMHGFGFTAAKNAPRRMRSRGLRMWGKGGGAAGQPMHRKLHWYIYILMQLYIVIYIYTFTHTRMHTCISWLHI